jgi:deazaflavin-dependent oxidoreductase (nitroreductase family)
MSEASDWNNKIIAEFRANGGQVGGPFATWPMILVHHKGRKTGTERVNPLVCQPRDGSWVVFASKDGSPTHPDWYLNLMASPRTTIEFGTETIEVLARTAEGEEREAIWARQQALTPELTAHETRTGGRVIPVVILEPVA